MVLSSCLVLALALPLLPFLFLSLSSQMDKDHRDKHKVSDYKAERMKSSSSSGSCEVDAEMMNDDVSAQDTAPAATHECNLCGKTFSSGKALGGHRRSHFQAAKKKKNHPLRVKTRFSSNHSKADSNNNRASCDDDNDGKKLTCYLCNKKFPSKNALYGHMRSHPERVCRGVFPPTHHSHEHNSDSSMEQNKEDQDDGCFGRVVAPNGHTAIDLSKSTSPSWLKTDKRGRKCIGSYEAAENLVYLCAEFIKKGTVEPKSPEAPMPSKKRKIGESSTREEREVNKMKFYFSGSVKLGKKSDGGGGDCDSEKLNRSKGLSESGVEKISVNMDGKEDEEESGWGRKEHCGEDVNESTDKMKTEVEPGIRLQDHVGHFGERKLKKVKKWKKSKKIKESTYANGTREKLGCYKCGICGKSFSTFQGLGGHRSIHKDKNFIAVDESKHYLDATVAGENNSCSSIHEPKVEETPLSEEETLAGEAISQSTGPKKLDFDLNEPYVMED